MPDPYEHDWRDNTYSPNDGQIVRVETKDKKEQCTFSQGCFWLWRYTPLNPPKMWCSLSDVKRWRPCHGLDM